MYAMSCEVAVNTNCHFAHACWASIDLIVGHDDPFSTLDHLGDQLRIPFFMEFIIVMSWCIWMQRNDFIFKEVPPTQASCVQNCVLLEHGWCLVTAKLRELSANV